MGSFPGTYELPGMKEDRAFLCWYSGPGTSYFFVLDQGTWPPPQQPPVIAKLARHVRELAQDREEGIQRGILPAIPATAPSAIDAQRQQWISQEEEQAQAVSPLDRVHSQNGDDQPPEPVAARLPHPQLQ